MASTCRALSLLLTLLVVSLRGFCQSTKAEITARLQDKPLYIRGFWSDRKLEFDGKGDLISPSKRSTFSLEGFSFRSLKLKNGTLTVSGTTVGTEFSSNVQKRVNLPKLDRTIRIAAPANGDFGQALDAIFVDGLEALAPLLPTYWQAWPRKAYPAAYPEDMMKTKAQVPGHGSNGSADDLGQTEKVGGPVTAPEVLKLFEAQFNNEARALRYSGSTVIHLIVEKDGQPSQVAVVTPCGLGLDEMALAAVQQFQFAPARQAGIPIRVEVNIVVNFQIF